MSIALTSAPVTAGGWRTTPVRFAPPPARNTEQPALDAAIAHLQAGRWRHAFTVLAALADQGHPVAARLALLMAVRGAVLFGGHFPAGSEQRRRWAACQDDAAACSDNRRTPGW